LLILLRGAGLDGLGGMRPGARHPILRLRRHETEQVCRTEGLVPVRDPSNRDPAHLRNRVRHEVLPLLSRLAGRDVGALLARQADVLAEEAGYLDALALAIDPADARALATAPAPLARRAVRGWLREARADRSSLPYPPDGAAVERVLAVARGETRACEVNGGMAVRRSGGRLLLHPPNRVDT
jgi:tRNA(Ile)-lysidine synthase